MLFFCCGCASWRMSRAQPPENVTLAAPVKGVVAKIVRVKEMEKYVVADFGATLIPAVGTELRIFRGTTQVGRVQITDPRYPPFVTANVLEGQLQVGDTLRRNERDAEEKSRRN